MKKKSPYASGSKSKGTTSKRNEREDIVWRKGLQDGIELGFHMVEELIDQKLKTRHFNGKK